MKNNIQLLESNNSLMYYFQEITLGKYDDGEMSNFFIKSTDKTKTEYFIISESNDEEATVGFVRDILLTNNANQKVNESDINYDTNNFNIVVLTVTEINKNIEIKSLGIIEWLMSKVMYDANVTEFAEALKILNDKSFNLYVSNIDTIKNDFKSMLENENFKEIIEQEVI